MSAESYFLINKSSNIVENTVLWDGGGSWQPPNKYFAISQTTTPAKIWITNVTTRVFDLVEIVGAGDIEFTWDGTYLTTNEPRPANPPKLETHSQKESIK